MVCLLFIQKYTLISSQWPMIMAYYDTIKHCFAIGKGFSTVYFSWNNQILNVKINTYFQHLDLKPPHPLTATNCFFFRRHKSAWLLSSKSNQHFLNFLQYSAKHHSVFYPPFPTMYSYYTAYLIPDIPSPIFKHVIFCMVVDLEY